MAAAAVAMTSCQMDDLENLATETGTGVSTSVSFNVAVGDLDTKALASELGGWSNYKNEATGLQDILDHRLTVQIFATGATSPMVTVVETFDEVSGDEIAISDVRLTAGINYTAVVWVDFVKEDTDTDLWYTTDNLTAVSVINDGGMVDMGIYTQDSRDAYTAILPFTVDEDGLWTITSDDYVGEDDNASSVAIPLTATRPFAKLRVALTDYSTATEWMALKDSSRPINYSAITVEGTPTTYNALAQEVTEDKATLTYHGAWSWESISYVDADYKSVATDNYMSATTLYSVIDMNYVFASTLGNNGVTIQTLSMNDTDSYTAELKESAVSVAGTEADGSSTVVAKRGFATIPLYTNQLTTIAGNFITSGYNFIVIVDDAFSAVNYQDYSMVDGVNIITEKDTDGNIVSVTTKEAIPAANAADVIAAVAGLDLTAAPEVTLEFDDDVAALDISELSELTELTIILNSAPVTIEGVAQGQVLTVVVPEGTYESKDLVTVRGEGDVIIMAASSFTRASSACPAIAINTTGDLTIKAGNYNAVYINNAANVTVNEGVSTSANFMIYNDITGKLTATDLTVAGKTQILATGEVALTSSAITGDAAITSNAKITLTSSKVGGNLVATSTLPSSENNPAIRIKATTVEGTSTLTGEYKNVLVEEGSVLTGEATLKATSTNVNIIDSELKATSYLYAETTINLTGSTFGGTVYASRVNYEAVAENTTTSNLAITTCTFEANVQAYINTSFDSSIIKEGQVLNARSGAEMLTLTVTGDKVVGFDGKFKSPVGYTSKLVFTSTNYAETGATDGQYSSNDIDSTGGSWTITTAAE